MKKFYINANKTKNVKEIINRIRLISENFNLTETINIDEADLIISIGGDGTFLDSAQKTFNKNIEIFGIDKGTLGYLTEVKEKDIEKALKKYSINDYSIEERMLLECHFKRKSILTNKTALNDIVVSKKDSSIIGLNIYVKNKLLNSFYADGIIISSPTGSTGYSLSCGGPIVDPSSEIIIITPIAPHTMINRSIILPPSNIRIQLTDTKKQHTAKLSIDGQFEDIYEGDYILIKKSDQKLKIVTFDENNYIDRIKQKFC